MDLQLQGKRASVTGSTAEIGLAAAACLCREGADLIVNGRIRERVEEAFAEIRGTGAGPLQSLPGLVFP
jgi:NAD(P)-dependent dehydrogenase (short-subunit alcohol dehydrogenase family)